MILNALIKDVKKDSWLDIEKKDWSDTEFIPSHGKNSLGR